MGVDGFTGVVTGGVVVVVSSVGVGVLGVTAVVVVVESRVSVVSSLTSPTNIGCPTQSM